MQHCATASITRLAIENVDGVVRYFIDTRAADNLSLTGENSVVLTLDYLDQAPDRGRAVPEAVKHALSCRVAAIQIEWPLGRSLVSAAATAESNGSPQTGPPRGNRDRRTYRWGRRQS